MVRESGGQPQGSLKFTRTDKSLVNFEVTSDFHGVSPRWAVTCHCRCQRIATAVEKAGPPSRLAPGCPAGFVVGWAGRELLLSAFYLARDPSQLLSQNSETAPRASKTPASWSPGLRTKQGGMRPGPACL